MSKTTLQLVVTATVLLSMGTIGVVAADGTQTPVTTTQNAQTTTQTGSETVTNTSEQRYVGRVDPDNRIRSYSYNPETNEFRVVIESKHPSLMIMSDLYAGLGSGGVSRVPQKRVPLSSGVNVVTMQVTEYEGMVGVGLATSDGAVRVSERFGDKPIFEWRPTWPDLYAIIVLTALSALGGVGIAYWQVKNSDDTAIERWF